MIPIFFVAKIIIQITKQIEVVIKIMGLWKAITKTLVSRPSRKGKSKLTNERGTCEENEHGNNPIPKETTGI